MSADKEQLYQERLGRYVTAMRNGKPDKIPIRPFVAEFICNYAGYTCQEVTHDYTKAFDATLKCAADFDWDATVANMVYVWTGLTQAMGTKYYATPGIEISPNTGFQYLEPPDGESFMRADEYDALIDDPTGFLYEVWLPRISNDIVKPGAPATFRHNLALIKGAMTTMEYFNAFGPQIDAMRTECGVASAISGIFKAPFDILADKLRGYVGLTMDVLEQPDKVLAACEALMPHLFNVGLGTSDPDGNVPIGFWMHRGCTPFVTPEQYHKFYWPTLKPIIESFWAEGRQTLFYAEGDWGDHLESFRELPEQSIVFHVDRTDIFKAHEILGDRFCLSGGIPNYVLGYGTPDEVRDCCKKVIDGVAQDGGYIMDASAIMQNDTKVENMRALTDFTREYGVYDGVATPVSPPPIKKTESYSEPEWRKTRRDPGVCVPWEEKREELPEIKGDADQVKQVWENTDAHGFTYIWQCLLSF